MSSFDSRLLALDEGLFEDVSLRVRQLFREGDFYGIYARLVESGLDKICYFRDENCDEYVLRKYASFDFEFYNINSRALTNLSQKDSEDLINNDFSLNTPNFFTLLHRPQITRVSKQNTLQVSKNNSQPILGLEFSDNFKWDMLEDKILEYKVLIEFLKADFPLVLNGYFTSFVE